MFQAKAVGKIKTHFMLSNFFFPKKRAVCDKMWENIVERGRPQMTIWRMRIACWIPKATHTHTHTHTLTLKPMCMKSGAEGGHNDALSDCGLRECKAVIFLWS